MQTSIAELAKSVGLVPGQVVGALDDLGVEHDSTHFEADSDSLELINESLASLKGSKVVPLLANRTPRDIAHALGVPQPDIQKTLITKHKVMAQLTTVLKPEVVEKLLTDMGFEVQWAEAPKPKAAAKPSGTPKKTVGAQPRPPIVTILGHVDHGKTSLLDYIRKANVASKEAGGITQHIGAYQVELPEGKITFLDTPGHAAFTAMRARGAQVTDIAILVVAADDGIMPQTIEAISHVKNAGVPMIVAVNKMDKPEANPDRVMQQLTEHEVIPIPYGGDVEVAKVSAHTGAGVPELLELILLQAEIMGLTADPKAPLDGVVVEAKLEKGRGPVATFIVEEGTLKVGDNLIVGATFGKVKAMMDYKGDRLKEAGPSTPVEVLGLTEVPGAGDRVSSAVDEREARTTAEARADEVRQKAFAPSKRKVSLGDLRKSLDSGEMKTLNLIVKADVQGSVEAVRGMLEKVENEEVSVRVIHSGVGTITDSDILLASAADAICVGFNTRVEPTAKTEAERSKVEIRNYSIIYELIEDIEAAIKGMLAPKFVEEYQGTVEVRMVFNLTKYGLVAGCHVTDGKIQRNSSVRIKRGTELVWTGKVDSLKNVKQDAREMFAGQDCGIQFDGFTAYKEGDVIEAYELVQVN